VCPQCYNVADACGVTGWPIAVGERIETGTAVKVKASRDDYNTYVARYGTCPMTGSAR
jgi:hypothetical protein